MKNHVEDCRVELDAFRPAPIVRYRSVSSTPDASAVVMRSSSQTYPTWLPGSRPSVMSHVTVVRSRPAASIERVSPSRRNGSSTSSAFDFPAPLLPRSSTRPPEKESSTRSYCQTFTMPARLSTQRPRRSAGSAGGSSVAVRKS